MLDRLKTADRSTELHALGNVTCGEIEYRLHRPELFGRERHLRDLQASLDAVFAAREDLLRCDRIKSETRIGASGIHRGQGGDAETFGCGSDRNERETCVPGPSVVGDDDKKIGAMPVHNKAGMTAQLRATRRIVQFDADGCAIRATRIARNGSSRDRIAGCQLRQRRIASRRRRALEQQRARETDRR